MEEGEMLESRISHNMEPKSKIMLFSYFPLGLEVIRRTGLKPSQPPSEEVLDLIQEGLEEGEKYAQAMACIWLLQDGEPSPMLLVPEAKRIHADLVEWAENKPEDWFTIQFAEKHGAYGVVVFPDVVKSTERHGVAHLMQQEEILRDPQYQILTAPLHFVSQPGNGVYPQLKSKIGDSLMVYLYDQDGLDPKNPDIQGQIDEDLMLEVGRLKVDSSAESYLEGLIDNAKDSC